MGSEESVKKTMHFRCGGSVIRLRAPRCTVVVGLLIGSAAFCLLFSRLTGPEIVRPVGSGIKNRRSLTIHGRDDISNMDQSDVMVIDSADVDYRQLLRMQRKMYAEQNRPTDNIFNLNVTLSETISVDREIDDTRPSICKAFHYNDVPFEKATVIIPFYNEALSMLLRTVHSVLNRSPNHLLEEVILVDDRSTHDYLKAPLERYLHLLPKVRLVRNKARSGLIVSRMNGARLARTPILIFLDAHTETNVGWLEPLLDELQRHPNSIIQPFIDGIDASTIAYTGPPTYYRGAFSWDLRYTRLRLPDHQMDQVNEHGVPFFSPTLVGCALAVDRRYFESIGAFDEDLKVWGGENIELAWRTWMCGGRVVTVPCSRVGHIFKDFPYKFDGDKDSIVQKNLIRVAETWMGSAKKYFYASTLVYPFKRVNLTQEEWRSLEKRIEMKDNMNCKSFEWYLNEVVPEIQQPPMDSVYYGEIMQLKSRACWEVTDDWYVGMTYFCFEHKIIPKNYFRITTSGLMMYHEKCVYVTPPTPALRLGECPKSEAERNAQGVWDIVTKGQTWGQFRVRRLNDDGIWENFCIMQVTNVLKQHKSAQMPQLAHCDSNNDFQIWSITYKFEFHHQL